MNPIVVLGMRSGTSVIARILQECLGVVMDEGPIRKDWRNPRGYYEDHQLRRINKIALDYRLRQIGTGKDSVPLDWANLLIKWLSKRDEKYSVWGFKDPSCVALLKHMKQFLGNPKWIVPVRPFRIVVKSQIEKLGMNRQMAVNSVQSFYHIINREIGKSGYYIDMSRKRSEKDLSQILRFIDGYN